MENENKKYLHEIVITAIVVKDGKFLIVRRSPKVKRFPGYWTVPGGKMEANDYLKLPKDTEFYWYNVLEKTLRREVKEEVGINIKNIEYVTSLATVHKDSVPSLVISCMADFAGGKFNLDKNESDKHAWVSLKEAKKYKLLDGIFDELVMVENAGKGKKTEWQRFK